MSRQSRARNRLKRKEHQRRKAVSIAMDKLVQGSSEKAISENIATEIKAGKDPKQAAAIAYSVARENKDELNPIDDLIAQWGKIKGGQDESKEELARAHGSLTQKEEAVASSHVDHRENMPESAYLLPSQRKYPVKTKKDGEWKYSRNLLLAAARRARMNKNESLAQKADSIREREFPAAKGEDSGDLISKIRAARNVQETTPYAAGIMYMTDGKTLLVKRSSDSAEYPDVWAFPGGSIEEGETAAETAVRESQEELGFAPSDMDYLFDINGFSLFICLDENFLPVLNDEAEGYVWADPDCLPSPMFPGNDDIIKMVMDIISGDGIEEIGMDEISSAVKFADSWAQDKSAREMDTNGWFEVKNNPLSRVGVFDYDGWQLEGAPDPNKTYRVLRPADEVGSQETIGSCKLIPWIDGHVMLGREEDGLKRPEQKGVQGVTGQDVYFKDGYLYGNLKLFSSAMADEINAGKKQLSLGYRCSYDWTPGVYEGQPYDCVQRNIRGNHLALVPQGRMGPSVAVLDSAVITLDSLPTKEENAMAMSSETEGETGITLEEAAQKFGEVVEMVDKIIPILAKLKPMLQAENEEEEMEETEDEGEMSEEGKILQEAEAAEEAVREAAAENAIENKDEMEEKESEGMDEAAMFKRFEARVAARDSLAKRLSAHIGTFDHSQMSVDEVAAYGCKKIGAKVAKGQEIVFLNGYLAAAKAPSAPRHPGAMDANTDWLESQRNSLKTR